MPMNDPGELDIVTLATLVVLLTVFVVLVLL